MQQSMPDKKGHFGIFGGRYVAETLMPALIELEETYRASRKDKQFREEFAYYLTNMQEGKPPSIMRNVSRKNSAEPGFT